jgi:signal transduction histidine kinase
MDGSRFWASVIIRALHDEAGKLYGFAKVTRDLTHRRNEQRLRELTDRLNAVIENVADGIALQDTSGRVLFANEPAARACGFDTVQELLSAAPGDFARRFALFDENGAPLPWDAIPSRRAIRSGRREQGLMRVRELESGRYWWSLVTATPLHAADGSIESTVNIWHDVTAARQREDTLRFLTEAGVLLSSSLDWQTTLERAAQLVVPRIADWCAVDIVEGSEIKSLAVAHADPAKVALARTMRERYPPARDESDAVFRVIRSGRSELVPEVPQQLMHDAADDEEHWRMIQEIGIVSGMVVPLSARGRVLGAMTFVTAESARRFGESDLVFAEDFARQAALAVDNARLYREAQDAVRVRDEFLAIAGHELKTPLAALQLQLQSLERAASRAQLLTPPARLVDRLQKAVAQGLRLEQLIDDLLDVSRISAGRLRFDAEECDLSQLVRGAAERCIDELQRAGCDLTLSLEAPLIGRFDRQRLDQVVTNLLSNAIKYGRGKPVEIRLWRGSANAHLSVRDQGIGIAPADQARIFDRFERAVSQRNYGGIGLGLWIVRQIVEAHGGTIRVESQPGHGANFILDLPLA